jgi:hypothetical protein
MVTARFLATLGLLCFLPIAADAAGCADYKPAPTVINIELELPEPVYDLSRTIKEINKGKSADDWLEKNGMQKIWKSSDMVMLGYAEGGMAMMTSSRYKATNYDKYGVYYCPYVTHLDLAMIFRTRIVIPKEFPNGGCRFNAVNTHEYKHYKANRDVAEQFVRRLYKDLPVIIREIENRQPYVEGKDMNKTVELMKHGLRDAVESYIMMSMMEEGDRRNSMIDTPEEYAAAGPIMKACKD